MEGDIKMMMSPNTIEFIQDLVGDKWTVKFEDEKLWITVEDATESRLDPQQLTRIQSMGFDFDSILVTNSTTDIIFAPNGDGRLQ